MFYNLAIILSFYMGKNLILGFKRYILIVSDLIILYLSLWLTLAIRYQSNFDAQLWYRHFWPFTAVFLILLVIFYIDDLYEFNYTKGQASILVRILRDLSIGIIFAFAFFYVGQDRLFTIKPQKVLLINSAIAFLILYGWRLLFNHYSKSPKIAYGLLLVGYNNLVEEIIDEIKNNPQLGLQTKAIIVEPGNESLVPDRFKEYLIVDDFNNLTKICLDKKINTIVSLINPRQHPELSKNLFACLPLKISFFDIANFYEKVTGKIPVTTIEQIWFLENITESNKKMYEIIKRLFDLLFSLILLLITATFIPIIAILIKTTSKGPIFFTQVRTGKGGKNFMAIKFRTMFKDAEINGPQWATKNDSRVTPLGKFMRKTRIDEIPQLFNIIRGEMSVIGPRPERPEFIENLETKIPFYKERLLIKPGLTGWAQVMGPAYGGSEQESLEKLQYDLFYIKNRSLALDLSITLKTIRTVLSVKGQ